MAMDQFLKLEGIKGEAQDKEHKDQIDVLAWSWGSSNSGTTHMGSGSGSGKVSVQDLSVTKYVDKSSVPLMTHCFKGMHISKADLYVRKAGGKPLEYITILMEDVIITSISTGGSGGEDQLTENVTLNFGAVKFQYKEQKPDGSTGETPIWGWDIAGSEEWT